MCALEVSRWGIKCRGPCHLLRETQVELHSLCMLQFLAYHLLIIQLYESTCLDMSHEFMEYFVCVCLDCLNSKEKSLDDKLSVTVDWIMYCPHQQADLLGNLQWASLFSVATAKGCLGSLACYGSSVYLPILATAMTSKAQSPQKST